jgi:hypothetical protein
MIPFVPHGTPFARILFFNGRIQMKAAHWRGCLHLFAAATLCLMCSVPAQAQVQMPPNLALQKPVIDQSTRWDDQAQYDGQNVTDGTVCENDGNENGAGMASYWLASSDWEKGQYVTIDLQAPTTITEIHLRNTHNASFNDSGTKNFQIEAGNTLGVGGTLFRPSVTITDAVVILMGTLSNVDSAPNCPTPIPADIFDATSGLTTGGQAFRYIRFVTIDATHENKNVGLNEIEIYGSQ